MEQLKKKLSKYGDIQILKEGFVFILLMTGKGLAKAENYLAITDAVNYYAPKKYKHIEAMRNDDSFLCIILKP